MSSYAQRELNLVIGTGTGLQLQRGFADPNVSMYCIPLFIPQPHPTRNPTFLPSPILPLLASWALSPCDPCSRRLECWCKAEWQSCRQAADKPHDQEV